MTLRFSDIELTPDAFAAVMATGILSIAARSHQYRLLSETLDVLATLALLALVALVIVTAAVKRRITFWDVADPDVTLRLFSFVAAVAVLGSRVAAHVRVALILGAVASSAWLALILVTARNMWGTPWAALRDRAHGAWELASVATSGLVIMMALVADYTGHRWWLVVAGPLWVAAMCIYGLMTVLIVWRAVAERQHRDGFEPDTWILMGALAIATLAGDYIHQLATGWLAGSVRATTQVSWLVATLWIPPLIYFGLHHISRRPAALQFAGVWWAMVFPLGMYSAATYAMAVELGVRSLHTVSLVFFWNALAAWVIVVAAGLLQVPRLLR
ncbi:putative C4-dicarboxylate transporter [Mycobacterium xenopi RIVM700367]|uniref:tellurite resistance/C4-dicarboxylate transporter family protein n=1 Tax=Mycobacterium xenopi TaxID=1789 RepID=UPI00025ADA93|nr:tellurite resistance/C4-dicarboxylate transporter family protein [Mycobacterium xenopi]EID09154.1 putative C4-dicarboxylate transporter [Mycobacterium xenopi RIVM700367]